MKMLRRRELKRSLQMRAGLPELQFAQAALPPEAARLRELASSLLGLEQAAIRARMALAGRQARAEAAERQERWVLVRLPKRQIVQARMALADLRQQSERARSREERAAGPEKIGAGMRRRQRLPGIALQAQSEPVESKARMRWKLVLER